MARRPTLHPTQVELEILQMLWEHEPCPLGQIHEVVSAHSDRAYSTTRKMVQVMCEKGLVNSDNSARPQLYRATMSKENTQLRLLEDITKRAFGGSSKKLVMSLLSAERITVDDVREMQRLINKAKGDKR